MDRDLTRRNRVHTFGKRKSTFISSEETSSWDKDPPAGSETPRDLGPGWRTTSPQQDQGPCLLVPAGQGLLCHPFGPPQSAGPFSPCLHGSKKQPYSGCSLVCRVPNNLHSLLSFKTSIRFVIFLFQIQWLPIALSAKSDFLTRVPWKAP